MAALGSPVPHDEVRQQVERIISSPQFARSDLLTGFLRFIVESALRGDAESLKEWVIGVEAYGRGQDFDPRVDSIVRTEARRLRRKLREYYEAEGLHDGIHIELPMGSYEPVFRVVKDKSLEGIADSELASASTENQVTPDTQTLPSGQLPAEELAGTRDTAPPPSVAARGRTRSRTVAPPAIGAVLLFAIVVYIVSTQLFATRLDPVERLALLPVQYSPEDKDGQELGNALVRDLSEHLQQAGVLRVIEPATQSNPKTPAISQIGKQFKVDHVFIGTLAKAGESRYLTVRMVRVSDQVPVWTGRFICSWSDVVGNETEILSDIFTYVTDNSGRSQRRGRVGALPAKTAEEYELYARSRYAVASFNSLREKSYLDYAEQELTRALTIDPDFDDARVLLAKLRLDQIWGSPNRKVLLEESRSQLESVIKRQPRRADANALLAGVYGELGQRDRAMDLAHRALQLGPLNSDAHGELGRLYAQAGFLESAVIENARAFALDPTDLTPLGFRILSLARMGRQTEANEALNDLRRWQPGAITDLFAADLKMRSGDFEAAGRLISAGREHTSVENRGAFDIADGLRAALMGNRAEGRRVFDQFKDSPPRFFDHSILLAAQAGDSGRAIELIRQNPLYFNYRFAVSEPRLAPLRGVPEYWALLFESYTTWQRDLSRYGPSLPALPPSLPSPAEFLKQH